MPPRSAPWGNAGWNNTQRATTPTPRPAGPASGSTIKPVARSATPVGRPSQPATAPPAAALAAKKPVDSKDAPQLTVSTQSKKDEIGIQTLVGDYGEKGSNHGRKYYQKVQKIQGHEDIKVFLYYWDSRDGPDFCGWWFGDEIGGSQVWARSNSHTQTPPRIGWKIPWDAPKPEPGILLVDPFNGGTARTASSSATPGMKGSVTSSAPAAQNKPISAAAATERMKKATAQVAALETAAKEAVAKSKEKATAVAAEETLKEILDALQEQQNAQVEVQKSLTADISEARKGGPATMSTVTELSKLSPKVRSIQGGLSSELSRVKGLVQKVHVNAQNSKKQAEIQEKQKQAEEKDSKELQESLPAAIELVSTAEDAVESVSLMAAPLIAEPPEDHGDILTMAMEEIEKAASDAQEKITEVRKDINVKLTAARKYAPETRKQALAEYSSMQGKLTEAQKKLNPYKQFKKEFQSRVEAKKAVTEISDKLSAAELEVEKATMTSSAGEQGQMSEDEVASAEEMIKPAQDGITAALRIVDQKMRGASGALLDELNEMKERGNASRKKLEGIIAALKRQREGLSTQQMTVQANDHVVKAEESLVKCQEAEMPFFKGLEVLPQEESSKAIKESEAAAALSQKAVSTARAYIKSKLAELKRFTKEVAKVATEDLTDLNKRAEAAAKKLEQFNKDTAERKTSQLLGEVVEAVSKAEKKVSDLGDVAKVFMSEGLETVSTETLKTAVEKSAAAEKEAAVACGEARKQAAIKQKEAKSAESSAALGKLNTRLNNASQELAKLKKAAATGEKMIKGKEVIVDEEAKITEIEAEIEKAKELSSPREDLGEERLSDERVSEMVTIIESAQKAMKASGRVIDAFLPGAAPAVKTALDKFKARIKVGNEKIVAINTKTKDQRERVQCENNVKEGGKKVDEVEAALEKMNEAELPFLKGIEVLPLKLATETIKESEAVATAAQSAISKARTFIAAKNLEAKHFAEAVSKPALAEFSTLTERINAAAAKLSSFRKDTEARKKTALMQETSEKIALADAETKKLQEAVEPLLKEDAGPMSEEEADALGEKLSALSKEAQEQLDSARTSLAVWSKDSKPTDAHKEAQSKMQTQMAEVATALAKARKVSTEHEHKFTSKKILAEVNERLLSLEQEVEKTTEACSPLIEQGGLEFLVQSSTKVLASVLGEYMKTKELVPETLFKQINADADGNISQEVFVSYLEKLPEAISRDEVQFSQDRRLAIFQCIDKDKDGAISLSEFKDMFRSRYVCVAGISMTDVFEVSKSKTVGKVEPQELLEGLAEPSRDETTGMMRLECRSVSEEDKNGFVTMRGNQGTVYLEMVTPYSEFLVAMDKAIDETNKSAKEAMIFLRSKEAELGKMAKSGAATEARAELTKSRTKAGTVQTSLDVLKRRFLTAKAEFAKKEVAEKNAHIEARERKEADALSADAVSKADEMNSTASKLDDVTKPFIRATGEELTNFPEPLSLMEEAERLNTTATEAMTALKAIVKEQIVKIKTNKGPLGEAKREMQKMDQKATGLTKSCKNTIETVRAKCRAIVDSHYGKCSSVVRNAAQKRGTNMDALFAELAKGEDKISEESFCSHLEGLEDLSCKHEHLQLIFRHIEAGGIGSRKFLAFIQQYYKVVKSIAITNDFDVGKAKTLRKADIGEVIEVIDGPCTDGKLGLQRIKGKSLTDNAEGWISVMGNQGTPFLQAVEKPFYCCRKESKMYADFGKEGAVDPIRTMKVEEVLELVEGPRKEVFPPALRLRGKACADGASGWLTVTDKMGCTFAELDTKYYICSASVAITDILDIQDCKVLRKLQVGEIFTVVEGPADQGASGITRVKGKCQKDGVEGWVTTKGNAGTVYAGASSKHYRILREVPLQKKFSSESSEEIRTLPVDEVVELLEGPKEETFPPEVRVKGKVLGDGAVGWIPMTDDNLKPWSTTYRCVKATPIHEQLVSEDATVVRELGLGEKVELLEGPAESGNEMRMKACAEKDGATGWVTIRDAEGKQIMLC